jgi:hypothetical protein
MGKGAAPAQNARAPNPARPGPAWPGQPKRNCQTSECTAHRRLPSSWPSSWVAIASLARALACPFFPEPVPSEIEPPVWAPCCNACVFCTAERVMSCTVAPVLSTREGACRRDCEGHTVNCEHHATGAPCGCHIPPLPLGPWQLLDMMAAPPFFPQPTYFMPGTTLSPPQRHRLSAHASLLPLCSPSFGVLPLLAFF